jgi:RNA polymerase sigma-70 factor (ECF subfamily)
VDERELIKSVQSGNVKAFSQLVDRHKNMVYSLVYRMVKPTEDAEEVAQDSFLKAFKSIKQFKGDSKFSTWLYRIAYFTAISHLRKNKMLTSEIDMSSFQNSDKSALDMLNDEDQKYHIEEAMNHLKPIERNLITLFYLDEFSNKEIEKITGLTQSNIKVSLLRTRKKLFGIMKKRLNGELETILKN